MRIIFPSEHFEKKLVRFLKQHRDLADDVREIFRRMEKDVRDPKLKTHKLHGKMQNLYACDINYSYRIVFTFDSKFIYPESVGDHDHVY